MLHLATESMIWTFSSVSEPNAEACRALFFLLASSSPSLTKPTLSHPLSYRGIFCCFAVFSAVRACMRAPVRRRSPPTHRYQRYCCSYCGCAAFMLAKRGDINNLPRRRTDNAHVVDEAKMLRELKLCGGGKQARDVVEVPPPRLLLSFPPHPNRPMITP
jgi:hypothetical protein